MDICSVFQILSRPERSPSSPEAELIKHFPLVQQLHIHISVTVFAQGSCSLSAVLYFITSSWRLSLTHSKLPFCCSHYGSIFSLWLIWNTAQEQQCSWRLPRGKDRKFPSITASLDSSFSLFQTLQIWFTSSKATVKTSDSFRTSAF